MRSDGTLLNRPMANGLIWLFLLAFVLNTSTPPMVILGLALQGQPQTTKIDANRSAVFRNGFTKKKQKNANIIYDNLQPPKSFFSPELNP